MGVSNVAKYKSEITYLNNKSSGWTKTVQIILDILAISLGALFVFFIRFAQDISFNSRILTLRLTPLDYATSSYYLGCLIIYICLIILIFKNYGLYLSPRGRSSGDEMVLILKGVSIATVSIMIFMYLFKIHVSRFVVLASWLVTALNLSTWRYIMHKIEEKQLEKGYGLRNVLIVGAGNVANKLSTYLDKNKQLGLCVKGFLDDYKRGDQILGKVNDLSYVLKKYFIDEIYITIPSERELVKKVALEARRYRAEVRVIPELYDGVVSKGPLSYWIFGELPVIELSREEIPEIGLFIKRAIDIVSSLIGIFILLPAIAVIAIAIKIDSPGGKIIYCSPRVGKKGNIFKFYKFRTMIPYADDLKEGIRKHNERNGPFFKIKNDPRITRTGRFLRKYKLDEIPQFFNVLMGDMSLVGPRPHPLDDFKQYTIDHYRRLEIKPGLTSLWAIYAQDDPSFETNLRLDLYYIEHWSLWLDIKVILKTIPTVLKGEGN